MKKIQTILLGLIILSYSCSSDDDGGTPPNQNPTDFIVSVGDITRDGATLTWTSSTDPEGSNIEYTITLNDIQATTSSTSFVLEELDFATSFSGTVTAMDEAGGSNSQSFNFETLDNLAPSTPSIISPSIGETSVVKLPTFEWTAAEDPEGDPVLYTLTLIMENGEELLIAENISETQYTLQANQSLGPNHNYTWRVVASDNLGAMSTESEGIFISDALSIVSFSSDMTPRSAFGAVVNNTGLVFVFGGSNNGTIIDDFQVTQSPSNYSDFNTVPLQSGDIPSPRRGHTLVSFNNHFYLIGGRGEDNDPLGGVYQWNQTLFEWTQVTNTNGYSYNSQSVVFRNRMYQIGGRNATTHFDNVRSSADGSSWILETSSAEFGPRSSHGAVVHDMGNGEQIFVIGGTNGTNRQNDVWVSNTDSAADWTQLTDNAAFSPRTSLGVVSYDGKLWVFGGIDDSSQRLNDAWWSLDGVNWYLATLSLYPAGNPRANFAPIVSNDYIYLFGGFDGSASSSFRRIEF